MKRIIKWVETMLPRRRIPDVVDQPSKPITVEDLVMPDIYAEVKSIAKILDLSSPDSDKKRGFNPYDTARLHKK